MVHPPIHPFEILGDGELWSCWFGSPPKDNVDGGDDGAEMEEAEEVGLVRGKEEVPRLTSVSTFI